MWKDSGYEQYGAQNFEEIKCKHKRNWGQNYINSKQRWENKFKFISTVKLKIQ
jgi:hypothetical protein